MKKRIPLSNYLEPGTDVSVTYRPQSGTYCHHGNTYYYVNNVQAFFNTIYGYR